MSTKETAGLDTNRFYNMLQDMQSNRWRITLVILGLFTLIKKSRRELTPSEISLLRVVESSM